MTHQVASPDQSQASGQVGVSNHETKFILEKMVQPVKKSWSLRLNDAMWAYRTIYKTPMGRSLC